MKTLLAALLLGASVLPAAAQSVPAFTSTCDDSKWGSSDEKRFCETRDLTLPAVKNGTFTVDGLHNGGISVKGYSSSDIRVRARLQAWSKDEATAKAKVAEIKISTAGSTLRAAGLDGSGANSGYAMSDGGYAVSYEIFVPEKQDLALTTHNGGIHLENLRGAVTFAAQNGGVHIEGSGGDVRGTTRNGGLHITLSGSKWEGKGLDVTTTNGGINWQVPQDYSAQLYTSTQHGPIKTDFPTNVQGKIGREIALNLGKGGAPVKAVTTNGGIHVSRAGK
ncbi:hypothetical protein F0P96_01380 [Hymenobacter busanensis]|uniref:DUF4097 domain-containing protein n=1 Tax=Hymenobacter busanensis TaxID=2607656 RepID=A0A7L4ZXI1_9BACT|nr:DUF4097 family beta strand repeat-containing protein [Hymenobacter busanensis]KAA9339306.1 hypothetical protein F0P96_01380 [Hymenobacter busanensis]QHJ06932.1 hypothetical protein GUY19_06370 [Hymenobacter busanensis]